MGTPPHGAGSFSGQQGWITRKGRQGRWGNCAKGYFATFCFFFFVCKKWIPPPQSLCKILVPPPRKPCQKRVPPLAKGPPALTRNSEQSLRPFLGSGVSSSPQQKRRSIGYTRRHHYIKTVGSPLLHQVAVADCVAMQNTLLCFPIFYINLLFVIFRYLLLLFHTNEQQTGLFCRKKKNRHF